MTKKVCSRCKEEKELECFHKDSRRPLGVVPACKVCHAHYHKKYYSNPDTVKRMRESNRNYKKKNKSKIAEMNRVYDKERKKNDPIYCLIKKMRIRIWNARKKKKADKSAGIYEILGCSGEELHEHLVATAISKYGSYIDIDGTYHVDHIVPLDSASSEDELVRLCHYSNLQLLYPEDNLKNPTKS